MKGKNLSIEIKHPEGSLEYLVGWIYVTFKTRDAEITVHVSDVFNPAFEIAYLFYGLIQGSIPQLIEVDEEGEIKVIRILPYEDDQVRFQIEDYNYGEGDYGDTGYRRMHMDIILNKKELIEEFCSKFIIFLENEFQAQRWRGTNLKEYYLPAFKKLFPSYIQERR
ncbi:MAG: hypothetical protein DRH43_11485 [Deltaproteobacteria bacterium]|nr:MAG: hypothetical protein DRH43_11485 [Deltaproteobacteria bacterium]